MLDQRQRMRSQAHQLVDAVLFATAFPLAYWIREALLTAPLSPFDEYYLVWVLLIPLAPLVLRWQGFYDRSTAAPQRDPSWSLLKSCGLMTLGLILTSYLLQLNAAGAVLALFGCISFGLVLLKEEIVSRTGFGF